MKRNFNIALELNKCNFNITLELNNGIIRDYYVRATDELRAITDATRLAVKEGYQSCRLVGWEKVK